MKPLEEVSEVLAMDLRFGFEEVALRRVDGGGEGVFYGMAGYREGELVDPKVGDGSGGCCTYEQGW